MFKAVANQPDFSGQAPAIANKPTSRMILSRAISDNISAEKKSKWQKAKYHALVRLMAVSNHQIGTLDLPHLVINQVTLPQKFNFRGANLRYSEFKQVTMTAVNLRQSDLSHANMARCPMKRANLSHATLYHTQLENAHLEGADLRHANLSQAQLGHALLNRAKFQHAYFNLTNLYCAKLKYVNLSGAHLNNVDLSGAWLCHANLRNADLRSANLSGTCLNNANLSGVKLNPDSLSDINFKGAIIKRAINLDLSAGWSRHAIDNYFNANDRPGGGILQAIDSINAVYQSLKVALVRKIMISLQQTTHSLTPVAPSLLNTLSSAPYYLEPDIARWLQEVCSQFIGIYNSRIMRRQRDDVLRVMLDTFNAFPEMMITHNAAFIQAIAQAIYARPTTPTAQQAKELYARYLTDRRLVPYVMKDEFGEAKRHYPNWEDSSAANYVLFAGNQSAHAMLISQNDLESLLDTDKSAHDHRDYHIYNGGVSVARHDYYWETLRQEAFPLFQSGYLRRLCEKNIIDVMAHLYLNTALERLFIASTQQAYSSVKLVRPEQQLAMNELWANRVYQFDANDHCTLDDGFYQRLMTLALFATAPPVERAQILFCLAAVFAKCASSSLFGTEDDSPYALRSLASAFLDKACTLPDGITRAAQASTVWKNSLLGRHGEFTCAAVITDEMLSFATIHFPAVLKQVMPVDWR